MYFIKLNTFDWQSWNIRVVDQKQIKYNFKLRTVNLLYVRINQFLSILVLRLKILENSTE